MSDDYFREGRTASIAYWGLGQMLRGAATAAACLILVGLVIWGVYGLGRLLPEDSKLAPDPNTWDTVDRGEP